MTNREEAPWLDIGDLLQSKDGIGTVYTVIASNGVQWCIPATSPEGQVVSWLTREQIEKDYNIIRRQSRFVSKPEQLMSQGLMCDERPFKWESRQWSRQIVILFKGEEFANTTIKEANVAAIIDHLNYAYQQGANAVLESERASESRFKYCGGYILYNDHKWWKDEVFDLEQDTLRRRLDEATKNALAYKNVLLKIQEELQKDTAVTWPDVTRTALLKLIADKL